MVELFHFIKTENYEDSRVIFATFNDETKVDYSLSNVGTSYDMCRSNIAYVRDDTGVYY